MNINPDTMKLPALISIKGPGMKLNYIRALSEEEVTKYSMFTEAAASASHRFKLFQILSRNYDGWKKYTTSLLAPGESLVDNEILELDRLLLNFLSSAKSLLDHFKTEWTQKFRKDPKGAKYLEFIHELEGKCWAFAFFQDLRNFTQHCGLPVGNYSRRATSNSVTLLIECDPLWLTSKYKEWGKSKLTREHPKLNYLELVQDYFFRLTQDFGDFVATHFAPDLMDAHNFFTNLSNEVVQTDPEAQYRILTGFTNTGPNKYNFQISLPPSDLLGSLGIIVRNKNAEQGGGGNSAALRATP